MKVKSLFNWVIAIICIVLLILIFIKTNNTQLMIQKEIEKIKQMNEKPVIVLKNIQDQDTITSPLLIQGEAKGVWFSEGSFPVVLTDGDGLIIAETETTVNSNWLTDDYVEFEAYLEFEKPETYTTNGHLIFQNANISNTTSTDNFYEIIVNFK